MITPAQCKAARALLDWSQSDLARRSGIGDSSVRDFEKGRRRPSDEVLAMIERAVETAGVVIFPAGDAAPFGGEGLRFASPWRGERYADQVSNLEEAISRIHERLIDMEADIEAAKSKADSVEHDILRKLEEGLLKLYRDKTAELTRLLAQSNA